MDRQFLTRLQATLGWSWQSTDLLWQVFVPPTSHELPERPWYNANFALLGDRAMGCIIAQRLIPNPDVSDREIHIYLDHLLSRNTFERLVVELSLDQFIFRHHPAGAHSPMVVQDFRAETFEAIAGSLFLDQGYAGLATFVDRQLWSRRSQLVNELQPHPKSLVQNLCQTLYRRNPVFRVMEKLGTRYQPLYHVGVYVGDELLADGSHVMLGEAENLAARNALLLLEHRAIVQP